MVKCNVGTRSIVRSNGLSVNGVAKKRREVPQLDREMMARVVKELEQLALLDKEQGLFSEHRSTFESEDDQWDDTQ